MKIYLEKSNKYSVLTLKWKKKIYNHYLNIYFYFYLKRNYACYAISCN